MLEAIWSAPAAIIPLLIWKWASYRRAVWIPLIGAICGGLYAFLLGMLVGPVIAIFSIPFVPFCMTIGALVPCVFLACDAETRWDKRMWFAFGGTCALLVLGWVGFYAAVRYFRSAESFEIVVVKLAPAPGKLHWSSVDSSLPLSHEETRATEDAVRQETSGELVPADMLRVGNGGGKTVILVMRNDVTSTVRLPMPGSGVSAYLQPSSGAWQVAESDSTRSDSITLSPQPETGITRISVQGVSGEISTEVGISHR